MAFCCTIFFHLYIVNFALPEYLYSDFYDWLHAVFSCTWEKPPFSFPLIKCLFPQFSRPILSTVHWPITVPVLFYWDSDQWISPSGIQNRVCSVMSCRHFAIIASTVATLERRLFLRYFSVSFRVKMPPKKKEEEKPTPLMGRFGTSLKCGIVGLPNVG